MDRKLVTFFDEIPEASFGSIAVTAQGNNTFEVTFASGVFLEVRAENGIISQLIVVLPDSF